MTKETKKPVKNLPKNITKKGKEKTNKKIEIEIEDPKKDIQQPNEKIQGISVENDTSFLDKINQFEFVTNPPETDNDINEPTDTNTDKKENPYYQKKGIDPSTGKRFYSKTKQKIEANLEQPPVEHVNQIMSGYLFLLIIDFAFPSLFCFVYNKLFKDKHKKSIRASELKLSKEELEQLQPIADEVVKKLLINVNPVWVLIISMGSIYFSNFVALTD